jgi:hypothetical protein
MEATTKQLLWMYETKQEIREYEDTLVKVYLKGHPYESVAGF